MKHVLAWFQHNGVVVGCDKSVVAYRTIRVLWRMINFRNAGDHVFCHRAKWGGVDLRSHVGVDETLEGVLGVNLALKGLQDYRTYINGHVRCIVHDLHSLARLCSPRAPRSTMYDCTLLLRRGVADPLNIAGAWRCPLHRHRRGLDRPIESEWKPCWSVWIVGLTELHICRRSDTFF
jgi:hypothetical protein